MPGYAKAAAGRAGLSRRRFMGATGGLGGAFAAMLAVGCGDDSTSKPAGTSTAAAASPPAGAATATAVATAAPKGFLASIPQNPADPAAEKDFKLGGSINRITNRPFGFDSVGFGGTSNVGQTVMPVYNLLVRYSNRANQKSVISPDIEGDLATAWEQPDETTLVFTLAPGIKWQNVAPLNGRPFTVEDLKYNFNRGATHAKSLYKNYYSLIQSVDDVGGGKVRLKLSKPYLPAIAMLTYQPFYVMPKELGEMDNVTTAVGTGGFIMTKNTPNVGIEYKKNPDYFKKDTAGHQLPYLDNYTLSFVADEATRLAQVEGGKADSCYQQSTPLSFDNAEDVTKRHPNLLQLQVNGQVCPFFSVAGHWNKPPWSDVRVRRALNMLMDRETIMKTVQSGLAHVGPFLPWPAAFDKEPQIADLGPNYKFDPKGAKDLLSAAGVSNFETEVWWYESGTNEAILVIFQQAAAQAGVKLNLNKAPDIVAYGAKLRDKSWPGMTLLAGSADFIDGQATQAYQAPGSGSNFTDIADPELDALYEKLAAARGPDRKAATVAIWNRHLDQVYQVMLPQKYDLAFWTSRLHNWRNTAMNGNVGICEGGMDHVWVSG